MRVLLDHCVPHVVRTCLTGHEVVTTAYLGWEELSNGKLLRAAADARFDLLLTIDRNMRYQQHVARLPLALLVLHARSSRIEDIAPLLARAMDTIAAVQPGRVYVVE